MGSKIDTIKGRIKEAVGALTDSDNLKREGQRDQVVGKVREKAQRVAEKVKDDAPFTLGRTGGVTISRTGFTGDLGYELWTTPDQALALWDLLFEAGALYGIRAVGLAALNIARIEAGFIIANADFLPAGQAVRADRTRSPFEVGLAWMIDFDKGHFNGRRSLVREKSDGTSKWALVGLDIEGNVPAEHALIYHDRKRKVGHVTAAVWTRHETQPGAGSAGKALSRRAQR